MFSSLSCCTAHRQISIVVWKKKTDKETKAQPFRDGTWGPSICSGYWARLGFSACWPIICEELYNHGIMENAYMYVYNEFCRPGWPRTHRDLLSLLPEFCCCCHRHHHHHHPPIMTTTSSSSTWLRLYCQSNTPMHLMLLTNHIS